MQKNSRTNHLFVVITLIIAAVVMRLMPHLPNFAPLAASALFAAAYLPKKYALIIPLLSVMISDYLLLYISPFSNPIFDFSTIYPLTSAIHGTTFFVWGSFMLSGLLGLGLRNKKGMVRLTGFSLLASTQFFLITNFAVWTGGMYARDISGLFASYIAGLPFFSYTIGGDPFYTVSFFGLYALASKPSKQETKAKLVVS